MSGSILALAFENAVYGRETTDWAAQSVGQDMANLLAFAAMLIVAFLARRGSTRAYLVWIGLLVYSAYTYAIYTFAVHFGPLFLLWVAVFGLSVYALIGALAGLDVRQIKAAFDHGGPVRGAARLSIGIGLLFASLWLSEIVPAMLSGRTPEAVKEVGLVTNPVHVLDLALLLPALVLAGVLLLKERPLGYVLVPVLLVATFFLGIGILSLMLVSAAQGLGGTPIVGLAVATLAGLEGLTTQRFLRRLDDHADAVATRDHL